MAIYIGTHPNPVSPTVNTVINTIITLNESGQTISLQQNTITNYVVEDPDSATNDISIPAWTRPNEWPNLDNLVLSDDFLGAYFTYNNTGLVTERFASFSGIMSPSSEKYIIAVGHIENNIWVQDTNIAEKTCNSGASTYNIINYSSSPYDYPVIRIVPATANGLITALYFSLIATGSTGGKRTMLLYTLHCVERRAQLPYLTTTVGSGDTYRFCTLDLQRDHLAIGYKASSISLAAAWYRGRLLQSLQLDKTETMNVTSLASLFEGCSAIKKLDLNSWNTSAWHVTTLANAWYNCRSLLELNISNWDTANWTVTTLANTWNGCNSLISLELSKWNTAGWAVTTLASTWYYCYSLRKLDVSGWNTTNWRVTTLANTWNTDLVLADVNLTNWNTQYWTVTTLASTWAYNRKRRNFNDIANWNTTNWAVTSMASTFRGCSNIKQLNLSQWDVSNWTGTTTLSYAFADCTNLNNIYLGWKNKTANWDKVTDLSYMFANDYALMETDVGELNTSNFITTTISYMFNNCYALKEIDLSNWGGSNWALTKAIGVATNCFCVEKIDFSGLDYSLVAALTDVGSTTSTNWVYQTYNLKSLTLPLNYLHHLNIRYSYCMPGAEIIRVLGLLLVPRTISGTCTINITELSSKISTAALEGLASGYSLTT